ncbi:MAG: hypothetical protein ACK5C3_05435, partial [bacterium]
MALSISLSAAVLAIAGGSSLASAQIVAQDGRGGIDPISARADFLAANPGAGIYDDEPVRGGRVSRVYG